MEYGVLGKLAQALRGRTIPVAQEPEGTLVSLAKALSDPQFKKDIMDRLSLSTLRKNYGVTPQSLADVLATTTAFLPGVGDAAGLTADVHKFATDPSSRTSTNFGLSSLGLLPFFPNMIQAKTLMKGLTGESGFAYHATNDERLGEIAESGKLKTFKPNYGTEQNAWPDGSIERRAYFSGSPEHSYQFAPEDGRPIVLRTKVGKRIFTESTGDLFARKSINAKDLEYLGVDDKWHPLSDLK